MSDLDYEDRVFWGVSVLISSIAAGLGVLALTVLVLDYTALSAGLVSGASVIIWVLTGAARFTATPVFRLWERLK